MVLLTMKEKQKIEVLQRVMDGKLKIREASHVLNRSERQVYRLLSSIRSQGIEGVIHKNRGNQHARTIWFFRI